jgi:nucleotide-binding universal stress UspA family protein
MVGIDGSHAAIGALAEAIRVGESESATVRAVSVVEPVADTITRCSGSGHPVAVARSLRDAAQAALARACDLFVLTGVTGETSLIDAGDSDVASVLFRESRTWGADLVVLGTHGRRGIERLLLGSTAETFLRKSVVPVLVIPSREGAELGEERVLKSQ